jgi:CO/xanthine dehydrogenase FAD-binding subunit
VTGVTGVIRPATLDGAVAALAENPAAHLLTGGTDLMVEVNMGHRRPDVIVSIGHLSELRGWSHEGDHVRIGAALAYRGMENGELADLLPALAEAARTVGSPQIRNAGTLGGNLGTCSPAGDTLPVLAALEASVEVRSVAGTRLVPIAEFMVGVKRTSLRSGEVIVAVHVPVLRGWQGYAKVGVRNAMVIATASACLAIDAPTRSVRLAIGAVAPTVVRASEAEAVLAAAVDWTTNSVGDDALVHFANAARGSARPIDDHRSTANYRRHAVGVLAARLARRAFPQGSAKSSSNGGRHG